jgi:hypothetical protein
MVHDFLSKWKTVSIIDTRQFRAFGKPSPYCPNGLGRDRAAGPAIRRSTKGLGVRRIAGWSLSDRGDEFSACPPRHSYLIVLMLSPLG